VSACLIPGSFDPVTYGHIDIIRRAARLFDRVTVAILRNPDKPGWLSWDEREALIRAAIGDENVRVVQYEGLLVDCARACGVDVIVRGLRAAGDFDYETSWARVNRQTVGLETVLLASAPECAHISATAARQLAEWGGSIELFVPPVALAILKDMGRV